MSQMTNMCADSSTGRASVLQTGGRGFDSLSAHHYKPKAVKLTKDDIERLAKEGLAFRREVERRSDKMIRRKGTMK